MTYVLMFLAMGVGSLLGSMVGAYLYHLHRGDERLVVVYHCEHDEAPRGYTGPRAKVFP